MNLLLFKFVCTHSGYRQPRPKMLVKQAINIAILVEDFHYWKSAPTSSKQNNFAQSKINNWAILEQTKNEFQK